MAKEQERARATGGFAAQRRAYKKGTVNRGHGEEGSEESKYNLEEENKRDIEEYVSLVNKNT